MQRNHLLRNAMWWDGGMKEDDKMLTLLRKTVMVWRRSEAPEQFQWILDRHMKTKEWIVFVPKSVANKVGDLSSWIEALDKDHEPLVVKTDDGVVYYITPNKFFLERERGVPWKSATRSF